MKFCYFGVPGRKKSHIGAFAFIVLNLSLFVPFLLSIRVPPTELLPTQRLSAPKVSCIKIVPNFGGAEGIGALVRRTQLAFFLSSVLHANIDFPEFESSHGYSVHDIFSTCKEAKPSCNLNEEVSMIARCPRGDCECLKSKFAPHLEPLARKCSVISVENVRERTMEYAGCIGNAVKRYLGMPHPPWEKLNYDALHFRQGDLAGRMGGKVFHPLELNMLLKHMCLASNRDIVVVTEGNPKLPILEECGDRLVLASDTSLEEVFGIFQHAKHVSLGMSSFASLVAEVTRPKRMFIVERVAETFEWMDCENWTVVSRSYAVFHFDSKEAMLNVTVDRNLEIRSLYTKQQQQGMGMKIEFAIPRRRWSNNTKWISTRRK